MMKEEEEDTKLPAKKPAKKQRTEQSARAGDEEESPSSSDDSDDEDYVDDNEEFEDDEYEYEEERYDDDSEDEDEEYQTLKLERKHLRNPPENTKRQNIMQKVKQKLKNLGYRILPQHKFVPHSIVDDDLKKDKLLLKNKRNACLYYVYPDQKGYKKKEGKLGRATNGYKRVKMSSEYGDDDIIIYIFDYENADKDTTDMISKAVEEIQNIDGISLSNSGIDWSKPEEITLDMMTKLSKEGLDAFPRTYLQSLIDDKMNGFINGAANVAGNIRATHLNIIEQAMTELYIDMGIPLDEDSIQDEHLHSDLMSVLNSWDKEVEDNVNKVYHQLLDDLSDNDLSDIEDDEITPEMFANMTSTLSWPRGHVNKKCDAKKVMILKKILGKDTKNPNDSEHVYQNAIPEPPSLEKDKMFDTTDYKPYQKVDGFNKIIQPTVERMENGEVRAHVMDTNDMVMNHVKEMTMVKWLTKRGWKKVASCYNLIIMKTLKSGKPSILFVVRPWCWMLYSGPEPENADSYKRYNSQATTAKTAQLCQALFTALKNRQARNDRIITNKNFFGNFLAAFLMRVYLCENVHTFPKHNTLFSANMLWSHDNLFHPDFHRLTASDDGVNRSQQEKAARPGKFDVHRWIRRDIQFSLSHINRSGNTLTGQVDKTVKMLQTQQVSMNSSRRGSEDQKRMRERLFRDYVKKESDVGRMIHEKIDAGIASYDEELAAEHAEANATAAAVKKKAMSRLPLPS